MNGLTYNGIEVCPVSFCGFNEPFRVRLVPVEWIKKNNIEDIVNPDRELLLYDDLKEELQKEFLSFPAVDAFHFHTVY